MKVLLATNYISRSHRSNMRYEKLLELINNKVSASLLIQTIKNAQSRNRNLKRKYVETDESDADISDATTAATEAESSPQKIQSSSSLFYEQGMQLVEPVAIFALQTTKATDVATSHTVFSISNVA